ncbi:protein Eaa [Salmonella enterica]|nr:protein Eaa [Salmonella enterica]EEA1154044.1 protein Eaa [Salmonella enterica]EGY5221533.1 protein Eaa [Salmonella enterica]EIP3307650.1 protein Eaa [Salmonella enterica]
MTTITREQLIEKLQNRIAVTANYPGVEEAQLDAAIFKIALASLEAEPIGAFHIEDQQVSGTTDYIKDGEWPIDNGVIDVYAVPPASVVPEEMPKGLAGQIVSLLAHNIGDKFLAQKIWNACRAALLNGGKS